jgi:hypothetical protein
MTNPTNPTNLPVYNPDAIENAIAMFDALARALDLADRFTAAARSEHDDERYVHTARLLREGALSFVQSFAGTLGAVPSGPGAPGPSAPGATPAPGAVPSAAPGGPPVPWPCEPVELPDPVKGQTAYEYAAALVFGKDDALSSLAAHTSVCWYTEMFDPDNRAYQHQGVWLPANATPPDGYKPNINPDTGHQWTAWEYVQAAVSDVFPTDIEPDDFYNGEEWEAPALFI